jgi:hypothetical protein
MSNNTARLIRLLRVDVPIRTKPANPKLPIDINHGDLPRCGSAALRPVVLKVNVVDPEPFTDAGLKLQLAPVGKSKQELASKLTDPV